ERDLLAPLLLDLNDQIDIALFLIGAGLNVLVLVDRVEILRLVQPRNRVLNRPRIVNIAFVDEKFATQYTVAGKRISRKFKPPERELLAFVDRDRDIDDTLVRVCRIVFELRIVFCVELQEALLAVSTLQTDLIVVNRILKPLSIRDLALFQTDVVEDLLLGKYRVSFYFNIADTEKFSFGYGNDDLESVVLRRDQGQRQAADNR